MSEWITEWLTAKQCIDAIEQSNKERKSEYVVHQFPPPRDNVYLVKRRDKAQLSLREIMCGVLPKLGKFVEKKASWTYTNAKMNCVEVTITYGDVAEDMPVWML